MLIWPPHIHIHLQLSSNAGSIHIFSCPPGAHGAVMAGTQGIGVSAPMAAAVAEATVGLDSERHMPKGLMFSMGAKSMMLAIGILPHIGRIPMTVRGEGATPKLHWSNAPLVTNFPISYFFSSVLSLAESFEVEGGAGTAIPSLMLVDLNELLASRFLADTFGAVTSPLNVVFPLTVVSP